jgi:hypothetical protein
MREGSVALWGPEAQALGGGPSDGDPGQA